MTPDSFEPYDDFMPEEGRHVGEAEAPKQPRIPAKQGFIIMVSLAIALFGDLVWEIVEIAMGGFV